MTDYLNALLEEARKTKMTAAQQEEQRRSFAYGNAKIENNQITRQSIDEQATVLANQREKKH